jgi:hypothetical protein
MYTRRNKNGKVAVHLLKFDDIYCRLIANVLKFTHLSPQKNNLISPQFCLLESNFIDFV